MTDSTPIENVPPDPQDEQLQPPLAPGLEQDAPEGQAASGGRHGDVLGAGGPQDDSTRKDPQTWVTGSEPMTGAQRSYLDTLAREAGEQLPADLTKAQASEHIDRLQGKTGRGA